MTDDTISRQGAIEHCKKRLYETALNQGLPCESDMCQDIAENRIAIWLNELQPAEPERKIYANMSDEEFERWLYEHGICNPNIHESIPCDAVPLLIDNAISELPSAQPEQRWIPCSERLPEESGRYLISVLDGVGRRTTVAPYQPRYKAWTMTGRMAYWKVIAWMPLPQPYKGGIE